MNYLSVCSGIEAATVAWHPLGWRPAAFAEIEPFPQAVLRHHHGSNTVAISPKRPSRPRREGGVWNFGDFTTIRPRTFRRLGLDPSIDLLVGGTPCQSFSVAGLRGGLDDDRGNLALEFFRLARRFRPRWIVWENVPGVLSSNGGRDFGAILGALDELGYGWAYRVLDAQYFGVPQRRRRVFVVGYLGDWRRAAAVLFERDSLRRNPPPRREQGTRVAALTANGVGTSGADDNQGQAGHLLPVGIDGGADVGHALTASRTASGRLDPDGETYVTHTLRADGFDASEDGTGRGTPLVPVSAFQCHGSNVGPMGTLRAGNGNETGGVPCIAFDCKASAGFMGNPGPIAPTLRSMNANGRDNAGGQLAVAIQEVGKRTGVSATDPRHGAGIAAAGDPMFTLQANAQHGVATEMAVRRLTPRECERLQGFPDDYTQIPWRGRGATECPDGPRYKALGNSMAVPVMRWIGERIAHVDALCAAA